MKKLTIAFLFCAFASRAQVKTETVKADSVFFTPKPDQLKVLQQLGDEIAKLKNPEFIKARIDELEKQQMQLIYFGLGEPVDPNTLKFDGKKFKAVKVK